MSQYGMLCYKLENLENAMNLFLLFLACGGKCPEGFEVNEEDQSCTCPLGSVLNDAQDACDLITSNDTDVDDTDTDTGTVDTGEDTDEPVDPWADYETLSGKIIIPTLFEGRLIPRAAFHYEVNGELLVYMAANSSASCDSVVDHLLAGAEQTPFTYSHISIPE